MDLAARPQGLVDLDDDPVEQVGVDALGEGVPSEDGLKPRLKLFNNNPRSLLRLFSSFLRTVLNN